MTLHDDAAELAVDDNFLELSARQTAQDLAAAGVSSSAPHGAAHVEGVQVHELIGPYLDEPVLSARNEPAVAAADAGHALGVARLCLDNTRSRNVPNKETSADASRDDGTVAASHSARHGLDLTVFSEDALLAAQVSAAQGPEHDVVESATDDAVVVTPADEGNGCRNITAATEQYPIPPTSVGGDVDAESVVHVVADGGKHVATVVERTTDNTCPDATETGHFDAAHAVDDLRGSAAVARGGKPSVGRGGEGVDGGLVSVVNVLAAGAALVDDGGAAASVPVVEEEN